jgi:hypothetical protein
MINKHSLKPYFCLNDQCAYHLNGKKKPNARHQGRWTLFKRANDLLEHKCASCGTLHEYEVSTGKLSIIDNKNQKKENTPQVVPVEEFKTLLAKLDADKA